MGTEQVDPLRTKGTSMRRLMLLTAGVALAAVPAVFGLTDNPALSHSVPVRIPSGAVPVTDVQTHGHGQGHGQGQGRQRAGDGSGVDGHGGPGGGGVAVPDVSRKGRGGGPTPDIARRDHGATRTPDISGRDRRAAGTLHVSGRKRQGDTTTPTVSPSPGKVHAPAAVPDQARVAPAAPDKHVGRPHATRGRSSSQGVGDGMSRGGGTGKKMPF
jgi:hypothetical protein